MSREKSISVALQGGGSHGAFTYGVLSRLAEDSRLRINAISGTSSGAVNGCLLCDGLSGGNDGTRAVERLDAFWDDLGKTFNRIFKPCYDISDSPLLNMDRGSLNLDLFLQLTRYFAPYVFNPADLNPLRQLLEKHIDFGRLMRDESPHCFVAATSVQTGKLKIFRRQELSVDHILASACLPSLHHAVKIDDENFWDGGFAGNPPVFPLIFESDATDIIIVIVHPLQREELPGTVETIQARFSEIAFSASFLREMRAIAFSRRYIRENWRPMGALEKRLSKLRIHIIHGDEYIAKLSPQSRYEASPEMITRLHAVGYESADRWLEENYGHLGVSSSIDLESMFE